MSDLFNALREEEKEDKALSIVNGGGKNYNDVFATFLNITNTDIWDSKVYDKMSDRCKNIYVGMKLLSHSGYMDTQQIHVRSDETRINCVNAICSVAKEMEAVIDDLADIYFLCGGKIATWNDFEKIVRLSITKKQHG